MLSLRASSHTPLHTSSPTAVRTPELAPALNREPGEALTRNQARERSAPRFEARLELIEGGWETACCGLATFDLEFRCVFVNQAFAGSYGKLRRSFLGRNIAETLPVQGARIASHLERCLMERGRVACEVSLTQPGAVEPRTYLRTCQPVWGEAGEVLGISATLVEVTEQKQVAGALREHEEQARHMLELNPHMQWMSDPGGTVFEMRGSLESFAELPAGRLLKSKWLEAIHPEDAARTDALWMRSVATGEPFDGEYRMRCGASGWRWLRGRARCGRDDAGEIVQWYGMVEDVDDPKQIEEALREKTQRLEAATEELALLVRKDHLTGLASRRHFDLSLKREVLRAQRTRQPLALLMLDADRFKDYNDSYGHVAGDACLRQIGLALQRVTRSAEDVVARYGGEEFAIVLPNTTEAQALEVATRAIEEARRMSLEHGDNPAGSMTLSAGVAVLEGGAEGVSQRESALDCELVRLADVALYAAKREGRNRVAAARARAGVVHAGAGCGG